MCRGRRGEKAGRAHRLGQTRRDDFMEVRRDQRDARLRRSRGDRTRLRRILPCQHARLRLRAAIRRAIHRPGRHGHRASLRRNMERRGEERQKQQHRDVDLPSHERINSRKLTLRPERSWSAPRNQVLRGHRCRRIVSLRRDGIPGRKTAGERKLPGCDSRFKSDEF